MLQRCSWANPKNESYLKYHDDDWGVEVHDDRLLFEMLILEGAQAGLSWETILNKRLEYKKVFDNFNVKKVSRYDEQKVLELLLNPGIVRNKLKIRSAIKNAKVFIKIQKEFGSFDTYVWKFVDGKQIVNNFKSVNGVLNDEVNNISKNKNNISMPVTTEISDSLSKDLKKRGMSFVGSTIMYAFMQSVGLVNDHEENCFCKLK